MKREGRQHGMVRTNSKYPTRFGSPSTAGLFTKVSPKPTNHPKFSGKCGRPKCRGCHDHPACKSKNKVKGALKIKSASDVTSNHRLITWRVVDSRPGLKFSGFSATGILDYLASNDYMDDQDYEFNENEDVQIYYNHEIPSGIFEIEEIGQFDYNYNYGANDDESEEEVEQFRDDYGAKVDEIEEEVSKLNDDYVDNVDEIEEEVSKYNDDYNAIDDDYDANDDDDAMSFCEVGFVWQPMDGDDSWYLVEEI